MKLQTFNTLQFVEKENIEGKQALMFFDNGFGISVIQGSFSYGNEDGLYELSVIYGTKEDWHLHYDNPIANGDVVGYLSPHDVTAIINCVQLFNSIVKVGV